MILRQSFKQKNNEQFYDNFSNEGRKEEWTILQKLFKWRKKRIMNTSTTIVQRKEEHNDEQEREEKGKEEQ